MPTGNLAPPYYHGSIQREDLAGGVLLALGGDLNWHTAPELLDQIAATTDQLRVVIDLSGVVHFDAAGTSAVIAAGMKRQRAGTQTALVAAGEMESVLSSLGLVDVLTVFPDRQDAVQWLCGGATPA